jgi:multiple sugar transport system substrate-binding protein
MEKRTMRSKKFALLVALMIVFAMLTGCGGGTIEPSPTPEDNRTWQEIVEEDGYTLEAMEKASEELIKEQMAEMKQIVPDNTQTGDLVIYMPPAWRHSLFNLAIAIYEEMYPNVNVTFENFDSFEAHDIQLATDIVAGRGPDILFPNWMRGDTFKMANAGAFLDLNEFIEQDEDFNLDDYVRGALDGGIFNGKRYAIPVEYRVPGILLSVPRNLNTIGFDMSQMTDVASFMHEAMRILPEAQKQSTFNGLVAHEVGSFWRHYLYETAGIQLVDYETNIVLPDEERLRQFVEAYKPYYPLDNTNYGRGQFERLVSGEVLFLYSRPALIRLFFGDATRLKRLTGYQAITLRGIDGNIHARAEISTAIRSGSPNAQNAWNFIKVLLSPHIQDNGRAMMYVPIRKDSIVIQVESERDRNQGRSGDVIYTGLSDEETWNYINILTNIDSCTVFRSDPIGGTEQSFGRDGFFWQHFEPYFKDEVSFEIAIEGLRNTLRLYVSE